MAERETILVVDDDLQVTRMLGEFLGAEGYAVLTAHTAQQALHILEKAAVSLALLDLLLPDRDGVALMGEIRQLESPPETVIITGHATLDSAIAAVEAGAAGYILKPVSLPRLGALVGRALERRRLLRENARLSAELAERLRETELLLVISRMISSMLDVREALRRICRELTRLVGADTTAAYLHDPGRDLLLPTVAYHVPPEHLEALAAVAIPLRTQGFYLPLWRDRRPIQSDDVPRDPRFAHEAFRRIHHQSGLLVPLILDSEVGGAFYMVWWTARRVLTDRELALLESVSAQVSVLLRNARLYEEGQRHRHRFETLNDVSRRLAAAHDPDQILSLIVEEATKLLGAEAAGLRMLEGDELVLRARTEAAAELMSRPRLKLGESLTGRVVATGEPIAVDDLADARRFDPAHKAALERGFHGFLGVPLRSHGRAVGALAVYTKNRRRFLPDEISLLCAFADQASLAIEKGRLLGEAEGRRKVLESLHRVAIDTQQLRTPLAGIKWMLELAAQGEAVPAETIPYVQDARDAAERLIGLVNDLLDVSRFERDKLTISPQPTRLGEMTRSVLDELAGLVRDKRHRLSVDGAEAVPPVLADPQLLRQVILNLVSNAIKYTPDGGDIAIQMSREGAVARWAIRDSGIGIPEEAQRRLFEKFYRAENVLTIETEGTGLGLYLVRLIMEQLGGRVRCESEEGKGSTFIFTLPAPE